MSVPFIVMIYAQADEPWAEWIDHCLTEEKRYEIYRIWEAIPATNKALELEEAIERAIHFIILFSPDFFATQKNLPGWSVVVEHEQKKPSSGIVVPIRIRLCNPSGLLQSLIPINLVDIQDEGEARNKLFAEFDAIHARAYDATQPFSPPQKPAFPPQSRTLTPKTISPQATVPSPRFPRKPFSNIPYARNPLFTEREELFRQIALTYDTHKPGSPAVVVLCGLHGSGKTQIAIEYAYHHFESSLYQYILWIDASVMGNLEEEVGKLLEELSPSEERRPLPRDDRKNALDLKQWLHTHERWLLVFDHIHNISVIDDYIPPIGNGHVLVTTCTQHVRNAYPIHIGNMDEKEAISFLLLRARSNSSHNQPSLEEEKYAMAIIQLMHRFPLALDQAGAYIASTGCGLKRYWERAINQLMVYLKKRGVDKETPEYYHPATIVDDWKQAFHELRSRNLLAADLLLFCTFFHPYAPQEEIFEEIFIEGRTILWQSEQHGDDDLSLLGDIVIELKRYSFILSENGLLTIHPLMQTILLDDLSSDKQWPEQIIHVIKHIWIERQKALTYDHSQRWFTCIQVCLELIDKWKLDPSEKEALLDLMQRMLDKLQHPDE